MTHAYSITGMTCASCVVKVKSELLKLGDLASVDVQLQAPQAVITMNKHIGIKELQTAVHKAGNYFIEEMDSTADPHNAHETVTAKNEKRASYLPVILIFGYITAVTLLAQLTSRNFDWMQWMQHFMAGFFLVFSFFKLMNLRGFAEGYSSYDVIARRFYAWGLIYPFVELILGIAFLTGLFPLGTNIAALIIMGVSAVGVIQNLLRKSHFECACLGTVIKLPLSKVSLFEDVLMVVMSLVTITLL